MGHVRFDYTGGQWRAYLYHDVTYPQLKELLREQGFSLPTAEEWAYLCSGDGGCNICGGMGPPVGFLPCSPHRKPEVQENDRLDGDYDFYRPIIRVE